MSVTKQSNMCFVCFQGYPYGRMSTELTGFESRYSPLPVEIL